MLGVVVATLVTWLSGARARDLAINVGNIPLWPIHAEWLSQSLMLAVTVLLVMLGARVISLPPENSAISVMLLIVTPHVQAMVHKGELRIAGAVLARAAWAVGTFLLVGFVPSFLLLAGLLFLGQFLASYLTRTAGENSYAGVQMGLVLPMLIVAPRNEFGSIEPAVQRLEGILLGLTASVLVAGLWPRFPVTAPPLRRPPRRERWMSSDRCAESRKRNVPPLSWYSGGEGPGVRGLKPLQRIAPSPQPLAPGVPGARGIQFRAISKGQYYR